MIQSFIKPFLGKKLFAGFIYVIISTYVFSIWIWSADTLYTSFNGDPNSKLSDLIYSNAHKPYVNRALIPFFTRTFHNVISVDPWETIEQQLLTISPVKRGIIKLGWEQEFLSEYLVALVIVYVAFILFPFIVRKLWIQFYETSESINNIIPIVILLTLPTLFWTGPHYIYDFPALFLFTFGLLLLLKQQWIFFYIIFILGCFNKETMIFLTPMGFILFRKSETQFKIITHIVLQVIIFGVIKWILLIAFSENPGTSLKLHVDTNIRILLQDYSWTFLFLFSCSIGLLFYDFQKKSKQLQQCFLLVVPFAVLILIFGIITELRAAYEIISIIIFLMLHTILFSILKIPYRIKSIN